MTTEQRKNGKHSDKDSVRIDKESGRQGRTAGSISLSHEVVAKIAGVAARDVKGIHSIGKSNLISFGNDPARGIDAEVGSLEAAIDLDVVIEYGCDIRAVSSELRERIGREVNRMAGREVVEVNINVIDIKTPEAEVEETPSVLPEEPRPRVR